MEDSSWNKLSREHRVAFVLDALPLLDPIGRDHVLAELGRVLKHRASTLAKRSPEALAPDLARSLTLLRSAARVRVFQAAFHGAGARAALFNSLVGFDADTHSEGEIGYGRAQLEPYRERFGEAELDLALDFVAEHGHASCRSAARAIRTADLAGAAPESRMSMMQETPESPAPEALQGAEEFDAEPEDASAQAEAFLDDWSTVDSTAHQDSSKGPETALPRAGSEREVASSQAADSAAALRELSTDWACAEMKDDEIDRVVLRAIVASINGEAGALPPNQLRPFVASVQRLNTARFRSYFYLGFVDALQSTPLAQPGGGMNSPRRAWYLSGYHFGMRRMKSDAEFLDGLESISDSDLQSMTDPLALGAAQKLLQTVVSAAVNERRVELLARWLSVCGPYDRGAIEEASRFALKELDEVPEHNNLLLQACLIALQWRRKFESIEVAHPAEAALMLALVGCMREIGGWKQFTDFLRPLRRATWDGSAGMELCLACAMHDQVIPNPLRLIPQSDDVLKRLVRELTMFARRFSQPGNDGAVAGIASLLRILSEASDGGMVLSSGEVTRIVEEMQLLHAAISKSVSARYATFPSGEFAKALEVLTALTVVAIPLESGFHESASVVLDWITAKNRLPHSVLRLAFENMLLLDHPSVGEFFVECVNAYGPDFVTTDSIARIATMPEARAVRSTLLGVLDSGIKLPVERKWELASMLGRAAAGGGVDPDLAIRCIDHLEGIADSQPKRYASQFIDLMAEDCWENVLLEETRVSKQAAMALQRGDYTRLGEHLSGLLQSALAKDDVGLAADALEALDAHGLSEWVKVEQRQHLKALLAAEAEAPAPVLATTRVLLVGGNEIQAAYDQRLLAWFREHAPGVQVEFIHSGWKSNWSEYAAKVERRLSAAYGAVDAIVVITMIRTILGEKVRALASAHDRPWVACTGRGFESLRRAAVKAAQLATLARARRTRPEA